MEQPRDDERRRAGRPDGGRGEPRPAGETSERDDEAVEPGERVDRDRWREGDPEEGRGTPGMM